MKWNNKENSGFSLKAKLLLMISLITIVVIMVVSTIFYSDLYNETIHLLQQKSLSIAESAAMLIDGDEFERISLSLDPNDKYYKESLGIIKRLNTNINQGMIYEGMLYAIVNQDEDYYTCIIDGTGSVEIGYKQKKSDFAEEVALAFENGKSYFSKPYYIEAFNNEYISAMMPIFNSQNQVVGIMKYDYEYSEILSVLRKTTIHIIKVTILLIVFLLIINYLVLKKLFKPIDQLVETIEIIANGDLTIEFSSNNRDEIGKINSTLSKTVDNVRYILEKIKESSKKVTIASKSILISSKDTIEAYEELAASTMNILDKTQKQVDVSRSVEITLEELQHHIQIISEQIDTDKKEHVYTSEIVSQSFKLVEEADRQISNVESRLASVSQVSSHINNYMNRIQDMIMTILRISEQATLLTLSLGTQREKIEQEKSDSVKINIEALIEQSNLATKEIEGIIQFLEEQIGIISHEIMESTKQLESGLKATANSKKFLMTIYDSNKSTSERFRQIDDAIDEILNKASKIRASVTEIEEVSTSIDSNMVSLLAITQEQVATSDEFRTTAVLLREQAQLVDDGISIFKIE